MEAQLDHPAVAGELRRGGLGPGVLGVHRGVLAVHRGVKVMLGSQTGVGIWLTNMALAPAFG